MVKVKFVEKETRRWMSEEGALISSVAKHEPAWIERNNARPCLQLQSDLELLLFIVGCYHSERYRRTTSVPKKIQESMNVFSAFTLQCPAKHAHSEVRHSQDWGLYLDLLLDALPGRVAKKLRVERCATWSDEYFWSTWTNACGREPLENPVCTAQYKKWLPEGTPQSLAFNKLFCGKRPTFSRRR